MAQTLFKNVTIFDGNAKRPSAGEVLLQGNLIKKVAKGRTKIRANGATVVDGAGATLMPGLIEPHAHVCYTDCVSLPQIGQLQPEEHMVLALDNARTMLDHGFTSLFSAAGVGYNKLRIEPVLRDVINAGRYPGPRIKAASPEIVSSGGLGDERMWHMHQESVGFIADGPDEVRKACRLCVREGVGQPEDQHLGRRVRPSRPVREDHLLRCRGRRGGRGRARGRRQHHHARTRRQGGAARAQARYRHHLPRRLRDD